ncbi:RIB43A-like with coiled-coils protein 2 isoform X2 [Cyclopterus lumpus]|uniref:RIB43A-like with coiled-coils protein 2 isoform X2 n=1 Tax=Cyclopterus lumpus TaxID=8103 RepID=UPI0014863860|nr:RIB43A-like with coiled-coils protein 2 isoform X2 [Cyclopterus lumpus]
MLPADLPSDRVARLNLQSCRNREAERRGRIFNHKLRTIGVNKEALDMQVKEKEQREEAAREEQNAHDADVLRHSKAALLFHSREVKERRAMEKATVNHRHRYQQPRCQWEFDPEDPDRCGKPDLPGLVGEDPGSESRRQRQKEQLREWLVQQQSERAAERHQRKLEEQHDDQSSADMRNKALQLQGIEMEQRKAATIATKDYNLATIEEKRCQQGDRTAPVNHPLTGGGAEPSPGMEGVPGSSRPSSDRSAPLESLQQISQFRKYQMEEKNVNEEHMMLKMHAPFDHSHTHTCSLGLSGLPVHLQRAELERKRDEEQHDRVRLDSSRTALLIERQQAKVNKQLRRQMDSTNVKMAETHKQQKPDIQKGCIDNSFFSKFNTCSR